MKKITKLLTLSTMLLVMPMVSGCSFIRTEDKNGAGIKEITAEPNDNGDIVLTITYADSTKKPVSFVIPKGEDGEPGAGIKNIEYTQDQYGITTVTITLTNKKDPVVFTLAPGKSIVDTEVRLDEEGNTLIYFIDSDGTKLDPITIYKGDTGETGTGIVGIFPTYNDDDSAVLTIVLSDGSEYTANIPAPKEGRGIESIVSRKEGTKVYLVIYYNDGTNEEVDFDATPTWTTGYARPGDGDGYDGDYYFDLSNDIIYVKINGSWTVAVNFDTEDTTYTVTFDLNSADARFVAGGSVYPGIKKGQTFLSSNYALPIPAQEGFDFSGWCTSRTPNPTNGYFTDLSPVLCDMTLYAIWTPSN